MALDKLKSSALDTNIDIAGTLDVTSTTTLDSGLSVAGAAAVAGHSSIGNAGTVDSTRALTVVGATDGTGSSILVGYNSSLASKFSVRDDGYVNVGNGLNLADGNLSVASGHGIDFSAGANAAGMTNELLDDYEEGTFTPTCSRDSSASAHTYGMQHGNYTKIGRMVDVKISIQITGTTTTGSGAIHITGLPFSNVISGAKGYGNTAVVHYNTALPGTADYKSAMMYYADARIHFELDATAQDTGELNGNWENGYISVSLTYFTS